MIDKVQIFNDYIQVTENSFCFFRVMLLNKLQEDGVALCRKGRLKEAAHRFSYALRKLPVGDQGEHSATFTHLRLHLTLNLSRCKRKMNVRS